jgi:predicted SAM-dependent methyltransferase
LYAGDIPSRAEYQGLIGLSITRADDRHLRHDITRPMPLPDDTVDSFQAEDVFEHIDYEELPAVIDEIFRVLRPGATLRLSVPDYRCDVLLARSTKDAAGRVVFDPGGGGTRERPGHVWFPEIAQVSALLGRTKFATAGTIDFLHHYNVDGSFVLEPIDHAKGTVLRTPDFDTRVQNPRRPLSLVVDLTKGAARPREASAVPAVAASAPITMQRIMQLLGEDKLEEARAGVFQIVAHDPEAARKNAIMLGHLLVLCAGWGTISSLIPRGCNSLAETGWLNSLASGQPVDGTNRAIPWFTYPAIEFLDRVPCGDLSVFEWGSGNSTLWWARRARSVQAVDHNESWYERVRAQLPKNASVQLQTEAAKYVRALADTGRTFDVVVIDGVHRNECAAEAIARANPDGLIVFDNSDRRANAAGIERLAAAGWRRIDFFGLIPSYLYRSCTSVFFKSERYLQPGTLPCEQGSTFGPTVAQVLNE